jgi:hypothetical protein
MPSLATQGLGTPTPNSTAQHLPSMAFGIDSPPSVADDAQDEVTNIAVRDTNTH